MSTENLEFFELPQATVNYVPGGEPGGSRGDEMPLGIELPQAIIDIS